MYVAKSLLLLLACAIVSTLSLPGCVDDGEMQVNLSGVGADSESATRRAALSVLDANGDPLTLTQGNTTVTVQTRHDGGPWSSATQLQLNFGGPAHIDTVLVADNSGSLHSHLPQMKSALQSFAHLLLNGNGGDRVGLVRVSTDSKLVQALTGDEAELNAAIDDLFVTNGWTAFYDGVRVANEALESGASADYGQASANYCVDEAYRAIVAFTDGVDNQSADQNPVSSSGDGIDTTKGDLFGLKVNNVSTPVYTVGIGDDLKTNDLEDIATHTGGSYRSISGFRQLKGALTSAANQLQRSIGVCFESANCADNQAKISVEVSHSGQTASEVFIVDLAAEGCSP